MYRNVDAELKRVGKNRGDLAKFLKRSPSTISLKLNGKADITLREAKEIKMYVKTNMPLEELFSTDF